MARRPSHKPPAGAKPTNVPGLYRLPGVKGAPDSRLGKPYFDTRTGETISRRNYLKAYRGGNVTSEQYAKSRPRSARQIKSRYLYEAGLAQFKITHEMETGAMLGRREARALFSPYNKALHTWSYKTVNGRRVPISRNEALALAEGGKGPLRAGGPIARALEAMGRRRIGETHPVGETPD